MEQSKERWLTIFCVKCRQWKRIFSRRINDNNLGNGTTTTTTVFYDVERRPAPILMAWEIRQLPLPKKKLSLSTEQLPHMLQFQSKAKFPATPVGGRHMFNYTCWGHYSSIIITSLRRHIPLSKKAAANSSPSGVTKAGDFDAGSETQCSVISPKVCFEVLTVPLGPCLFWLDFYLVLKILALKHLRQFGKSNCRSSMRPQRNQNKNIILRNLLCYYHPKLALRIKKLGQCWHLF